MEDGERKNMRCPVFSFVTIAGLFVSSACFASPIQDVSPPPPAFAPKYLEQIPLRYSDPDLVAKALNKGGLPEGVIRIQVDASAPRGLRVLGTQEGIATVRSMIALLDVKPRKATFRVVLERVRYGASGKKTTSVVGRKTLTFVHNVPTNFNVVDSRGATLAVSVTARLPQTAETPPSLLAGFGWREASGKSTSLELAVALPTGGQPKRVVGLTFVDSSAIIGTIGVGNTPAKWTGNFFAYYLSLQPVSLTR